MKILSYLLLSLLVLQSCTKSDNTDEPSRGDATISLKILGIDEAEVFEISSSSVEQEILHKAQLPERLMRSSLSSEPKTEIISLEEFDVLNDVQQPLALDSSEGLKAISRASNTRTRAAIPLASSTQYRILMYETTTGVLGANQVATAGTPVSFQVDAGKGYNWYAVSINTTSVPNINSSGIIPSAGLANQDVLYASGQITPAFGNNSLSITFQRLTARIEVDLNARGIFGRIQNSTSIDIGSLINNTFTKINRIGDLNVRTAAFSNIVDAPAISANEMTAIDPNLGDAVKKAVFHTVSTTAVPNNALRVRFNALSVTLDNGSTRTFTANTLVPQTGALTPVIGSRYVLTTRLIESTVLINNVRWARTNMLYDASTGQVDRYRFRPNNNYAIGTLATEFWNKSATTPAGAYSSTVDPCALVYPNNVWFTPTEANRSALGTPTRTVRDVVGGNARFSSQWDQASTVTPNPAYPDNSLILLYLGYYSQSNAALVQQGHLLSTTAPAASEFWLRENATTTSSRARSVLTQTGTSNPTYTYGPYAGATDGNRLDRKPYRCVRNN